jgi:tetraacyldisaccharide 4'-kinase
MVQNILVKILLAPFSLLYGILISIRNFLFQVGIIKRSVFDLPVINVGNLTIGGAGKTPHVERLISILQPYIDISVLSRGYGRKSKGFQFVNYNGNALQYGDEPLQFKRKNKDLVVAVSESRALGIPEILKSFPGTKAVLLDDAFQHLAVSPSLNILLTEYSRLFTNDYLLPSGRLREWRNAYRRADIIIVTKCPNDITNEERNEIITKINPETHQKVFFSKYSYGNPYNIYKPSQRITLNANIDLLLVSAIANTDYLSAYLEDIGCGISHIQYEDHHYFTEHELSQIKLQFDQIENPQKIVLSSEKDLMRLDLHRNYLLSNQLPIFALPIKVEFLFNEGALFDGLIRKHLLDYKI